MKIINKNNATLTKYENEHIRLVENEAKVSNFRGLVKNSCCRLQCLSRYAQ